MIIGAIRSVLFELDKSNGDAAIRTHGYSIGLLIGQSKGYSITGSSLKLILRNAGVSSLYFVSLYNRTIETDLVYSFHLSSLNPTDNGLFGKGGQLISNQIRSGKTTRRVIRRQGYAFVIRELGRGKRTIITRKSKSS